MKKQINRPLFYTLAAVACLFCGLYFAACDIDDDSYDPYGECGIFCERLSECERDSGTFVHFFGSVPECASDCEDNGANDVMRCMIDCANEDECVNMQACLTEC
jgi:hypothetical protein